MYWLVVSHRHRAEERATLDRLCADAATPGSIQKFYDDQEDLIYRQYEFTFTIPVSVFDVLPGDFTRISVTYEDIKNEVDAKEARRTLSFDLLTLSERADGADAEATGAGYQPRNFDYVWTRKNDEKQCTCGDKNARVLEWALAGAKAEKLYQRKTVREPAAKAIDDLVGMTIWLQRMWRGASGDDRAAVLSAIQAFRNAARFIHSCDSPDRGLSWPHVRCSDDDIHDTTLDMLHATERYVELKQQNGGAAGARRNSESARR